MVYILAIGKGSYSSVLSTSSPKITLTNMSTVTAVTNVKISDINDFGDGRDVSVSFTRPQNDSNTSNYRVFIVKPRMLTILVLPLRIIYPAIIIQQWTNQEATAVR